MYLFSLTFNKLKDVPEVKKETSTQSVPWWATFTQPPARPSTVSSVVTSTAAYTAADSAAQEVTDEPREDESEDDYDDEDDKVVFNTVRFQPVPGLEKRKSQNKRRPGSDTVGKLINVTGTIKLQTIGQHQSLFRGQCSHQDDAWAHRPSQKQR